MAVYSRVVALDQSWARSHLTFMIILLDNVIFQTRPHTNRIKKGSKYSTQKTFLTILGKYLGFKSLKKHFLCLRQKSSRVWPSTACCVSSQVSTGNRKSMWHEVTMASSSSQKSFHICQGSRTYYSQAEVLITVWTGYQQKPSHGSFCRPGPNHTKSLFYSLLL